MKIDRATGLRLVVELEERLRFARLVVVAWV